MNFHVQSGNQILMSFEEKSKALRWAAKYSKDRKCYVEVIQESPRTFVHSFDGR